MNALIALVIIGVLWIGINRVLTASLRSGSVSPLSEPNSTMKPLATWRDVPDNRLTTRFPGTSSVSQFDT